MARLVKPIEGDPYHDALANFYEHVATGSVTNEECAAAKKQEKPKNHSDSHGSKGQRVAVVISKTFHIFLENWVCKPSKEGSNFDRKYLKRKENRQLVSLFWKLILIATESCENGSNASATNNEDKQTDDRKRSKEIKVLFGSKKIKL